MLQIIAYSTVQFYRATAGLNNAEKGKGCLVVAALLATLPILFFCVTVCILVKGFGF